MGERQKLHALMFPLPHQGHLTPAINLALRLATNGLAVTFVNFKYAHKMLSESHNKPISEFDLFLEARKAGLDICYTTISDGLPDDFDRVVQMMEYYDHLLREFQPLLEDFIGNIIRSDPSSTYFLIADTLFSWQAAAAEKYNLVHISFWTQPALVFSLCYHSGIQSVNTKDFMSAYKESNLHTPVYRLVSRAFDLAKKSDFVLHNTVKELESSIVSALSKYQPNYAIGPVNFYRHLSQNSIDKNLWVEESSCIHWLQFKPPGSVLYISFGSLVHIFPAGFEDEIKGRGLIVPWCNQIAVLSNPAVGGFLTHCGWNSVIESIWHGIPMLCYPLDYDQPINRKLVVDDWKIGLNLCDGKAVHRNEVTQKIKFLMTGRKSREFSHQIINARNILRNAVEPGGSSERNFTQFLTDLKKKLQVKGDEQQASV